MIKISIALYMIASLASPLAAQGVPIDPNASSGGVMEAPIETQGEGLEEVGRTSDIGVGRVGERTRVVANADPMGRVESRIQNRIQNRIRTRIDRDYDPTPNSTTAFEFADEQVRQGTPE